MDIKVNDINPAKYNPRKMNDESRRGLKNSMEKFKDISGIVYNKRTKLVATNDGMNCEKSMELI